MININPLGALGSLGNVSLAVVMRNMPFILFWGFLIMIYIANSHNAERKVRRIHALQKELKEVRWKYVAVKSELMYNTKLSEVSKAMDKSGIELSGSQPKKIIVKW
jgi:Bacteriodetes cell division protein (FtsL-like)